MTLANQDRITATVNRTKTTIAHGLAFTPTDVVVLAPPAGVLVWTDGAPDATNVYLRASVPVTVKLVLQRWT